MDIAPVPKEDRARLGKMLTTLFDHWQLSTAESLALLGLAPDNRRTLSQYRDGKPLSSDRDRLERAGVLLGIHKSLRLLFPHNRNLAYAWMKTPNRAFDGFTPTQVIAQEGIMGAHMVRTYLDRQRGQ